MGSLKEIALELGLSLTAVSRALRDCDDIGEETKIKVGKKAIELGYVPLSVNKAKKTVNKRIAVLIDSLCSLFFGAMINDLIKEFGEIGFQVVVILTKVDNVEKKSVKEALNLDCDGIVTFLVPNEAAYVLSVLNKVPMLLFGRHFDYPELDCVYINDFKGGQIACEYLVNTKKSNKVCYIAHSSVECDARRRSGFVAKAKELGIEDVGYIEADEIGEKLACYLDEGYDGFFCFDDQLANYLIAHKGSKKVNVVGFNGIFDSFTSTCTITSIKADYGLMVKTAVKIILDKIYHRTKERMSEEFDCYILHGET